MCMCVCVCVTMNIMSHLALFYLWVLVFHIPTEVFSKLLSLYVSYLRNQENHSIYHHNDENKLEYNVM